MAPRPRQSILKRATVGVVGEMRRAPVACARGRLRVALGEAHRIKARLIAEGNAYVLKHWAQYVAIINADNRGTPVTASEREVLRRQMQTDLRAFMIRKGFIGKLEVAGEALVQSGMTEPTWTQSHHIKQCRLERVLDALVSENCADITVSARSVEEDVASVSTLSYDDNDGA